MTMVSQRVCYWILFLMYYYYSYTKYGTISDSSILLRVTNGDVTSPSAVSWIIVLGHRRWINEAIWHEIIIRVWWLRSRKRHKYYIIRAPRACNAKCELHMWIECRRVNANHYSQFSIIIIIFVLRTMPLPFCVPLLRVFNERTRNSGRLFSFPMHCLWIVEMGSRSRSPYYLCHKFSMFLHFHNWESSFIKVFASISIYMHFITIIIVVHIIILWTCVHCSNSCIHKHKSSIIASTYRYRITAPTRPTNNTNKLNMCYYWWVLRAITMPMLYANRLDCFSRSHEAHSAHTHNKRCSANTIYEFGGVGSGSTNEVKHSSICAMVRMLHHKLLMHNGRCS